MDRLLNLLYENARLSNAQIAAMLNVPERKVADKIKELEDEGIIRGYKALVNFEKCGNEKVTALIEVKVTPQRDAGFDDIARRILQFDEVESIYLMSGGYDLCLFISGRTFKDVAIFVAKCLAPIEGVNSTATHFVLRKYKDMGVVMCDCEADDRGTLSL